MDDTCLHRVDGCWLRWINCLSLFFMFAGSFFVLGVLEAMYNATIGVWHRSNLPSWIKLLNDELKCLDLMLCLLYTFICMLL